MPSWGEGGEERATQEVSVRAEWNVKKRCKKALFIPPGENVR